MYCKTVSAVDAYELYV